MNIQSGWAKGLRLETLKSDLTRPTSAKVRAAVFDIMRNKGEYNQMLDLYSGSGAMGLEALSQEVTTKVCFVDAHPKAIAMIRKNSQRLQALPGSAEVSMKILRKEALKAVRELASGNQRFDLVWMDPPYLKVAEEVEALLDPLANIFGPDGFLLIESAAKDALIVADLVENSSSFVVERQKKYGDTSITFCTID